MSGNRLYHVPNEYLHLVRDNSGTDNAQAANLPPQPAQQLPPANSAPQVPTSTLNVEQRYHQTLRQFAPSHASQHDEVNSIHTYNSGQNSDHMEVNSIHTYNSGQNDLRVIYEGSGERRLPSHLSQSLSTKELPLTKGTYTIDEHGGGRAVTTDRISESVANLLEPRSRPLYVSQDARPVDWQEREALAQMAMPMSRAHVKQSSGEPLGWRQTIKTKEHCFKVKLRDQRARNEVQARSPSPTKYGRLFEKEVRQNKRDGWKVQIPVRKADNDQSGDNEEFEMEERQPWHTSTNADLRKPVGYWRRHAMHPLAHGDNADAFFQKTLRRGGRMPSRTAQIEDLRAHRDEDFIDL